MSWQLRLVLALVAVGLLAAGAFADQESRQTDSRTVTEILAKFQKGDPDWKVRMESLVRIANAGPDALPMLVDALQSKSRSKRQFAAQALAVIHDPATRPALVRATTHSDATVRSYAVRGLGMMGAERIPASERSRIRKSLGSTGRRYASEVLSKDQALPEWKSARATLMKYDLAKLDTARIGRMAPDFVLTSALGKTYRLSQFRGKKIVLLEFNSAFW